jgi:YVTN family beta-propeller protein
MTKKHSVTTNGKYFLLLSLLTTLLILVIMLDKITLQPAFGIAGISVGSRPYGVALDKYANIVYVTNSHSDTISVINGNTDKIITNVDVGTFPYAVTLQPANNLVYVANYRSNTVSVIDPTSNKVIDTINVGTGPYALATTQKGVLVANSGSDTVSVINETNNVQKNIPVGLHPTGIAINPKTNMIYVTNEYSNTVSVIDGTTYTVVNTISVGRWPYDVDVNSGDNMVYVTNMRSDTVSVINGTTNKSITDVPVPVSRCTSPSAPFGIAVNSNTGSVYVTHLFCGVMSVIDGNTNNVVSNVIVGDVPQGIAVNPGTKMIYVVNAVDNTVSVINGTSNKVTVVLGFGVNPPSSGTISCNGKMFSDKVTYVRYDIDRDISCAIVSTPNENPIFHFIRKEIYQTSDFTFKNWSGISPYTTVNSVRFIASQYGNVAANFMETRPSLPRSDLVTLFSVILGIAITSTGAWVYRNRSWFYRRGKHYLNLYSKRIKIAYNISNQTPVECSWFLEEIRKQILELAIHEKIRKPHYEILINMILHYQDQLHKAGSVEETK